MRDVCMHACLHVYKSLNHIYIKILIQMKNILEIMLSERGADLGGGGREGTRP